MSYTIGDKISVYTKKGGGKVGIEGGTPSVGQRVAENNGVGVVHGSYSIGDTVLVNVGKNHRIGMRGGVITCWSWDGWVYTRDSDQYSSDLYELVPPGDTKRGEGEVGSKPCNPFGRVGVHRFYNQEYPPLSLNPAWGFATKTFTQSAEGCKMWVCQPYRASAGTTGLMKVYVNDVEKFSQNETDSTVWTEIDVPFGEELSNFTLKIYKYNSFPFEYSRTSDIYVSVASLSFY